MLGLHPKIQTCHSPCKTSPSGSPGPHPCAEEAPQPLCGPEEVPWQRGVVLCTGSGQSQPGCLSTRGLCPSWVQESAQ